MNCLVSITSVRQASLPNLSLYRRHHEPPNIPDSLQIESVWSVDIPSPSILPQAPSSLLLVFRNTPTKLCLPAQLPLPWGTYTCNSEQESRLSLQPVGSQDVNSCRLHAGWHISNTVPLFSCLGACLTHMEILIWLQLVLFHWSQVGIGQRAAFSGVTWGLALLWFGGKFEGQMLGISGS